MSTDVIERLAARPEVADLEAATRVTVADLIRFGCAETEQAIGTWGQGANACALSTAALGYEALRRK